MKYFTFLLFFPFCLFGQNWQPLYMEDKYNFSIDTNEYITNTLWVDSMMVGFPFSTYFLNRIATNCDHCDTISAEPETLFLERKGQFLGATFIVDSSGGYHFSGDQDFSLYPHAPLDYTWIYQSNASGDVIARVAQVGTMEIFGTIDSVKHIVLDELDTILISKNFGLLSFPTAENNFDLLGIEGRDLGEILPGIQEFYDFQVGDVFQIYLENNGFGSLESIRKLEILGREEQDSSMVYLTNEVKSRVIREPWSAPIYQYSNTDFEWIIDLSYNSPQNFLNETYPHHLHAVSIDLIDYFCNDPAPDEFYLPIIIEKEEHTGRVIKKTESPIVFGQNSFYTFINDTSDILKTQNCIGQSIYEHVTGLGEIYSYTEVLDNWVYSYLMGYVKDGDTTGIITPDAVLLSVEDKLSKALSATIHPNFSNGIFQLKTTEGHALQLTIYDVKGRLIQEIKDRRSGQDIELDLTQQPNGIYFVRVWLDDQYKNIKIVKM